MSRFELKLPDDVIKAIRQRALDVRMRPSQVMEDLVREHFMGVQRRTVSGDGAVKILEHLCNGCGATLISADAPCPECGAP